MYRNTYAEINLENIEYNVHEIISKYNKFNYYFGVVKADSYGHGALETVDAIIKGGVNYLVVALLEEALELRTKYHEIPILCLGLIKNEDIEVAIKNNITLSILNINYLNSIDISKLKDAKIHIKINTGMNRLGVSTMEEFNNIYKILEKNKINIEGIYSHIHTASDSMMTNNQFKKFEYITRNIDLMKIKIIHIQASEALTRYEKPKYVNGCRLGIIMYGFNNDNELKLKSTFKLYSNVIQINTLEKNDTVGYNAEYKASGKEKIAVIPIGYADGIIRKNTGMKVYINNKPYKVIGNVCMDMLFVKIDESVKVFDKVEIIRDKYQIEEMARQLNTIVYEVLCNIGKRVPRIYK
ncbi:MAG: alanine racemase [Clostridium sp.]|nr:alanine racemase [Clostridium sp.]MCM1444531.1 alanine racemase [Candidatus Amulumruptor caecigallinarius]